MRGRFCFNVLYSAVELITVFRVSIMTIFVCYVGYVHALTYINVASLLSCSVLSLSVLLGSLSFSFICPFILFPNRS
ncbi:hypothetical protein BDF20DRAFT_858816 [Mycotypha africana]|uniref:uncharacterized protein n=1 Tax=Mycotypha africana TaxID=64632 RepID=UPI0022FFD5F9|nr:uncharacterized protein BDF20DRAFT_858816 [Mycotypha africana]KAI8984247.1 hypothetical protein BDF20DRAFT_858816 [Mycotypha africana]